MTFSFFSPISRANNRRKSNLYRQFSKEQKSYCQLHTRVRRIRVIGKVQPVTNHFKKGCMR